ncbi:MAG: response regulator [Alphaproteobacteria bacterium]|nr:response regulator [Alphaproteobacteria bacterium]
MNCSVSADPACWHDWYALIISAAALEETQKNKVAAIARALLKDCDGTVLCLNDAVLVVVEKKDGFLYPEFVSSLWKEMASNVPQTDSHVIAVWEENQELSAFLERHIDRALPTAMTMHAGYPALKSLIPHIDRLLAAWMLTCKNRYGRKQPHIMIVDDDPVTRHILTHSLKQDYPLVTAQNASEAIEKHLLFSPDIIFLDIGLPDCDGLTLVDYMRQYDPQCRIVMFSSNGYLDNRLQAFTAGASGFISKPFNRQAFERYISGWVPQEQGEAAR